VRLLFRSLKNALELTIEIENEVSEMVSNLEWGEKVN
jgi:hypothetical protein